jgi:hypothetical protein
LLSVAKLRLLVLLAVGLAAVSASAQMSEADRLARCANNREALEQLEARFAGHLRWNAVRISEARTAVRRIKAASARAGQIASELSRRARLTNRQYSAEDARLHGEMRRLILSIEETGMAFGIGCRLKDFCEDEVLETLEPMISAATRQLPEWQAAARQMAAHRSNLMALGCDPLGSEADEEIAADGTGCGLGEVWNATESGHSMKFTRRGGTNIFIVTGTVNGQPFKAEQNIFIAGNNVTINRYQASDGNSCNFKGTLQGSSASGTYDCTKFKPSSGWSATISC